MTETPRKQTLRKHERLYEKTTMDRVFREGKSIHNPPIKLLWVKGKEKSANPVKVGFSVPKRMFKKAVTRNLLKRRMREAYRKNKIQETELDGTFFLMFTYNGSKINPYAEIESKIVLTLQHFKSSNPVK